MKKIILLMAFMLFFASSAWSLAVYNPDLTYVGYEDNLQDMTTQDGLEYY